MTSAWLTTMEKLASTTLYASARELDGSKYKSTTNAQQVAFTLNLMKRQLASAGDSALFNLAIAE